MPTPLEQYLELLEDDLLDSKKTVGNQSGPLSAPANGIVATDLTHARQHISDALAEINNSGTADPANLPSTLPAIATECVILASTALAEAGRANPDQTAIGDDIKTIDRIITVTNGYRQKAGIT